ncbi:Acyl-[acyl-carrier-protein]--UDP-N-acetylglucosamine O-acyltransferase [Polaribacter huanghezhanensis]|uniref:acyl-ACP--UDP-N-acetylglucosamine O-acyltransferase n=1 Tax=Polaribacter huanghezhanensis TaxID=1354726 RepID=UPI00264A22C7|nr:acyl-ACP--UDP-N-acetylglucosamine O-acyltransferase [Polaribacter huanghezhanensis]WKD86737.1 Acyl-[acyl-carrier-protein]--UDP-N-acetylglucosamine O-acyltransferase [Polaribacter huanghezhanensis]
MNQPLAYIHPQAKIARNVVVEPFTTINNDVEIGSGTWIGSNVTIMEGARIGKNCRIFPGAVISAIPQDLKFEGEDSLTVIGDNTTIRECVTINRGTNDRGKTVVGDNCLIMAAAHIAHDCVVGNNSIIVNGVLLGGHVVVGEYAVLGGLSAIHQFIQIGDHAMVSGGSLVRKDVPPYTKAAKEPLSYVGINSVGLRRRGFPSSKIKEIQDIYRILYQKNYNTTQAIEIIEAEMEATPERDEIMLFIRNSQRGIMKGYTAG